MSSGGQQPVTQQTTQTRDPWSVAQPALGQALNSATTLYNQDVGYQPWTGQTQSTLNPYTQHAMGQQADTQWQEALTRGSAGVNAARGLGLNQIQSQGISPGIQQGINQYNTLYNEASGQENPYLQSILAANNQRIGDRINASMSGAGRYGSGQHTDVMARSLAEMADPILAQDYARRQQQRMQATGAASDLYGQGLQRAGQWSQLMPGLDEARWQSTQGLMGLGQYTMDREQAQINDQMKRWNAEQARQWEQIARLSAIGGGAGALGGTQVTASPVPNQPSAFQRIGGGALAGAGLGSMFGTPGAGIGALGGGLLGLMG